MATDALLAASAPLICTVTDAESLSKSTKSAELRLKVESLTEKVLKTHTEVETLSSIGVNTMIDVIGIVFEGLYQLITISGAVDDAGDIRTSLVDHSALMAENGDKAVSDIREKNQLLESYRAELDKVKIEIADEMSTQEQNCTKAEAALAAKEVEVADAKAAYSRLKEDYEATEAQIKAWNDISGPALLDSLSHIVPIARKDMSMKILDLRTHQKKIADAQYETYQKMKTSYTKMKSDRDAIAATVEGIRRTANELRDFDYTFGSFISNSRALEVAAIDMDARLTNIEERVKAIPHKSGDGKVDLNNKHHLELVLDCLIQGLVDAKVCARGNAVLIALQKYHHAILKQDEDLAKRFGDVSSLVGSLQLPDPEQARPLFPHG